MSWQNVMKRVLPPIQGQSPDVRSAYGAVAGRKPPSTIPHRGADFNYSGGQNGINLAHPEVHAPVTGRVVTNPGQGTVGRIAIRDANDMLHEILHTSSQHVKSGQVVFAGDPIGTMGNVGTKDQHVHYQLRDAAGQTVDPAAFWDRQDDHRQYQRYLDIVGGKASNRSGKWSNGITPDASDRSNLIDDRFGIWASAPLDAAPQSPPDRPESFDGRFGTWGSVPVDDRRYLGRRVAGQTHASGLDIAERVPFGRGGSFDSGSEDRSAVSGETRLTPPPVSPPLGLFTNAPMPIGRLRHRSSALQVVRHLAAISWTVARRRRERGFLFLMNILGI